MSKLSETIVLRWLVCCFGAALFCTSTTARAEKDPRDLRNTRIDLNTESARIIDLINLVSTQTDYVFLYEDGIKEELNGTIRTKNVKNLHDLLDHIARQSRLEYQVVNRNIVIRQRTASQTLGPSGQRVVFRVTGRVVSVADGTGLPGVNIVVKGTNLGTSTDGTGNFALDAPDENATLVFSYVGYEPQEVAVAGRSVINIRLAESSSLMNEVVVTALGIEREKRSLGYSVAEVAGDQLTVVPQENVLGALAGRVAGVTINQTSGPGSTVSMIIRGATSISSDNQPLFVIDGVPVANTMNNLRRMGDRNEVDYGNAISDLNPEDIASISVLKGPSAAALYGSRAGNGVVLITTKKGQKGQGMNIAFSTSNVFERPMRYLNFHYQHASGNRVALLDERSAYWSGPQLDVGNTAVQWTSPVGANGVRVPTELRSYPDNMKNFLETGITSTNNIALSGSSEKATYRISFNNMTHKGMIPNSDLFRNALSTSTTFDLRPNLKLSADLNLNRSSANDRPATANRGANALEAVYNWPHVNVQELRDYWVPGQEGVQQLSPTDNFDNPYFIAYGINNGFVRNRAFGNFRLDRAITPSISAFVRAAGDMFFENRETKIPWSYTRERRGGYYLQDLTRQETNTDFLVTYNKSLANFSVSVSGGGNIMSQNYRDSYIGSRSGVGLIVPGLYRVSNIPNTGLEVSNGTSAKSIYSLYWMTTLGFKYMLYLDLTARNDWSSTLPATDRSYFYPSASVSWLANYTFNLPQSISLLKFRAGIAQVGNDTQPYQLEQVLGTGSWGNLITTGVPSTLLNPQLLPEIATSQEAGIDFNLFSNRLRLEGTYYYMENQNQIFAIGIPASSGYDSKMVNAGLLASRGWEVALGATPVSNANGWNLDLNLNFNRFRTTVKSLPDGVDFITLWDDNNGGSFTRVGEEIGNLYSRGFAYVKDPSSPYYRWPILNSNGSWIPNNDRDARVKVGNFNPDFLMGMQAALSFRRFTLTANFDLRAGGNFQSYTYRYGESDWKSGRQKENLIPGGLYEPDALVALLKSDPERYVIPQNGNFPRVGGYTQETGGFYNDNFGTAVTGHDGVFIPGVIEVSPGVYREHLGGPNTIIYPASRQYPWSYNQQITFDASFVKLREISFGYDIPKILGFRNANFSVYSRNIIL
ncbi:SusC/RagA family TonB-linked outer membrane protein [soil metagenome]